MLREHVPQKQKAEEKERGMKQNKIISINYKIEFEFIPQSLKVECSLCVPLVLTRPRQGKKKSQVVCLMWINWEVCPQSLCPVSPYNAGERKLKLYDMLHQHNLRYRNQGGCVGYLWFGEELFWLSGVQTANGNYLFQRQSHISLVLDLLFIHPPPLCPKSQIDWKQRQQKSLVSVVPKVSKTKNSLC